MTVFKDRKVVALGDLQEKEAEMDLSLGMYMHSLLSELFPINRSITGDGVRKTLHRLCREVPEIEISAVPTGTRCFDWTVPEEWNVTEAFIEAPDGRRIVDFEKNNLHVVGYSMPVDMTVDLAELQKHLYSLPEQPDVIPYVTSYYVRRWGFCISDNERKKLQPGIYRVRIDSSLFDGNLTYGEAFLPGQEEKEILLSTYICHPSLANDNLSGPVLLTALMRWLIQRPRRFSYRAIFLPETIGSIAYISRNLEHLKQRTIAGFVLTCVGDDGDFSFLPSRSGNTLTDRLCRHVLKYSGKIYKEYSFLERGSDERQYCSPGVDLPVASIMKSKYGTYSEYHTSKDDLSFVTPKGLQESFDMYVLCLKTLEKLGCYKCVHCCEPQLGKRGLYPNLSMKNSASHVRLMMNFLAFADGQADLLDIAECLGVGAWDLFSLIETLKEHGLVV